MLALHADTADFCFTAPASSSYILIFSSNVVVENNRSAKHNRLIQLCIKTTYFALHQTCKKLAKLGFKLVTSQYKIKQIYYIEPVYTPIPL